jgi:hypothetical protein
MDDMNVGVDPGVLSGPVYEFHISSPVKESFELVMVLYSMEMAMTSPMMIRLLLT